MTYAVIVLSTCLAAFPADCTMKLLPQRDAPSEEVCHAKAPFVVMGYLRENPHVRFKSYKCVPSNTFQLAQSD